MLSAGAERDFMQDCTKNELMMAVRTVMMNWMMVFHRLRFLNIADSFLGHLRSHRLHRGHRFCKVTQKSQKSQKEGFA